jgi:hypothetical protein
LGTTLTEIVDLFLSKAQDYKLDALFNTSGSFNFNVYVEPWLFEAITQFTVADQSLNYTSITSGSDGYFDVNLNLANKMMLANIMVIPWLSKGVNDLRQMQNFLTDHDFKGWAPQQVLASRDNHYNLKREEISQMLVDYSYNRNQWGNWKNQIFSS